MSRSVQRDDKKKARNERIHRRFVRSMKHLETTFVESVSDAVTW